MSQKECSDIAFKNRFLDIYEKDIKTESPLLHLKTSIWKDILFNLPFSEMLALRKVNTKMKILVENSDHWIDLSAKAKLHISGGIRKKSIKSVVTSTYRNLMTPHVGKICDYCLTGRRFIPHKLGAHGIVPVKIHSNNNVINFLCLKCRQTYFEKHPEPPIDPFLMHKAIGRGELIELRDYYCLTKTDIRELRHRLEENGKKLTHGLLLLEARRVLGGENGIKAQQQLKKNTNLQR